MNNKLKIDWDKLKTFTLIPLEISSICKYNGKKFSADHKNIYSYFHKLQHDGKLNDTGYASFDALMKRFGIGSKGSLTGFINHLVDVGLLIRHKEGNGTRNRYEVKDIDLELATYPSKSHVAGSNKNKVSSNNLQDKKANNFLLAKKYRAILKGDKLKAFNQWIWKADQEGIQLTAQDYATWSENYTRADKTNFEDMTPCDGTESYFTEHPPVECYQFAPVEPDGYDDETDANFGFVDDINLDDCPTFYMCDAELASYEQCLMMGEETEEREDAAVYNFVQSCYEKPEPVNKTSHSSIDDIIFFKAHLDYLKGDFDKSLKSTLEDAGVTNVVEAPTEETDQKGDKSKLVGLIGNTDISDIDVESKGVGWFAAPLARDELNIVDTKRWLKVLHTHFWDDYSPDQTIVESIHKKLTCECCGNKVDDLGYCTDRDCPESDMLLPF